MKRFLSFALLALILSGCSGSDEGEGTDSSLIDMYNDGESNGETDNGDEETGAAGEDDEVPVSEGPMEIPDDLLIPE